MTDAEEWTDADWQDVFDEVDAYFEDIDAKGDFADMIFKNTFIDGLLRPLTEIAEHAATQSAEIQSKYLDAVSRLRDRSIELGRANVLKENEKYRQIQRSFPQFGVPTFDGGLETAFTNE